MPERLSPAEVLADFKSTCRACCTTPHAYPMASCPRCLLAHYCDKKCQERDGYMHSVECPKLAVAGFQLMCRALRGCGVEVSEWIQKTSSFVTTNRKLPDGLTAQQVEELVARARVAFGHLSVHNVPAIYYELLVLRNNCARWLQQEAWDQQAFLPTFEELLSRMPSHGPVWSDQDLMPALISCGDVLCELGRPSEAVDLGRRTKLLVEEAVESTGTHHVLVLFLMSHGEWLHELGRGTQGRTDALQSEEKQSVLREAETVLHQALQLLASANLPEVVARVYVLLARVARTREAFDGALKYARRGMQAFELAEEGLHAVDSAERGMQLRFDICGELAQHAIECLMVLRRDAQAGLLISEILAKSREEPRLLTTAELGMVYFNHGVILCRQGDYDGAYTALGRAESCISGFDKTTQERQGLSLCEIHLHMLEVAEHAGNMKALEKIEEMLGAWVVLHPRSLLRTARRWLADGRAANAMRQLRAYVEDYQDHEVRWKSRARWREGDALKPLELLRDLLEEGSEERAKVEALIERTTREDEELKQQALEELQREMREGRAKPDGGTAQGPEARSTGSKAGRKKRRKRQRKRQQRQQQSSHQEEDVEEAIVDLAALSLDDKDETGEGAGMDEEEQHEPDECPMCLRPFGEEDEEGVEVLQCRHRFHDVCIDRWLCKCKEKGLLPTCPMCRSELVRGGGGAR